MGNLFKKEFLLGIGVGCIISAFLVSLFGVGTMSNEEVIARASKLGMIKQDMPWNSNSQEAEASSEKASSEKSSSEKVPGDNTSSEKSGQSQDVNQSQTADQSQTTKPSTVPAPSANPAPSIAAITSVTTSVTITDRMGSESIARLLEEKGVVKDQYEFLKVVDSHNAQRRFQTGTFKVTVGGDMEEILEILTGKKR